MRYREDYASSSRPGLVKGAFVRISKDLTITRDNFQTTNEMIDMKGKVYKVQDVYDTCCYVNSWTFDNEDLEVVAVEKKSQPFHFDVDALRVE